MSLMCTSYASNPARSNAAAISTWPLTPCSRRIATFGRAPVAMYGRGDVLVGIERQARHETGIVGIDDARVLLVGGDRDCRAGAASHASSPTTRDAGRCAIRRARSRRGRRSRSDWSRWRADDASPRVRRLAPPSRHAARPSRAPARPRPVPPRTTPPADLRDVERNVEAAARRERHFGQRHEQSAVADVVIGEQRSSACRRCTSAKKAASRRGSSRSGASLPSCP